MDLNDLQHKRKSIPDLIRFISNTTRDEKITPNFSVFLGAGASVTSGIRSGQALVNAWMDECVNMENEHKYSREEYFSPSLAPEWYDPSNAYSSLFEHRYDLQRQRRIFVEHEVAGKSPSFGYAYLVNLIENGFFNTIFTTNFDDLLNEAFYQFSTNRPIVCAHDSSISGVSVTSDRPKIIKLHGDYLFDNIKTTLRETETLETNMRQKFQEFAKDYGLIVVGYSGQDRSIMDILTFLLQQEDYFKNGIYWCIRKGEGGSINGELKKLLWRDRVFYVEIDGFDELMAELNYYLNEGKLPVDDQFLSHQHQASIIASLTENTYIKNSKSPYLIEDCRKLNGRLSYNLTNDVLQFLKRSSGQDTNKNKTKPLKSARIKPNLTPLTKEQKGQIEDISNEAFLYLNKNRAKQKLSSINFDDLPDSEFKLELLELYANLNDELTDSEIKKIFEELLRLNPRQQSYYEIAANRSVSFAQSKDYLSRAIEAFPNDFYIFNSYADLILSEYEEQMDKSELNKELPAVLDMLNTSLSLNRNISNPARRMKAECIRLLYANNNDKRQSAFKDLEQEVIQIHKYHPATLKVLDAIHSDCYTKKLIEDSISFYSKADNPSLLEECYLLLLDWQAEHENFEAVRATMENYEKDYEPSDSYKRRKFHLLEENEYLTEALALYDELKITESIQLKKLDILGMMGNEEELDTFYSSLKKNRNIQAAYLCNKKDWQSLNELYEEWSKEDDFATETNIIAYSYSLLQAHNYEGVERLLKPYYDNPTQTNGTIVVNFLFARKMNGKNVESKIREKVIESRYIQNSDYEMVGAYGVLKDRQKTLEYIRKILKKCPVAKYNIRDWPILTFLKEDQKFIELMTPKDHV